MTPRIWLGLGLCVLGGAMMGISLLAFEAPLWTFYVAPLGPGLCVLLIVLFIGRRQR